MHKHTPTASPTQVPRPINTLLCNILSPFQAALMALAPCDSTALVLNDGWCPGDTPRWHAARRLWRQAAPWVALASCLAALLPLVNYLMPLHSLPQLLRRTQSRHNSEQAGTIPLLLDV
jgi:hypothetical protein